MATIVKKKNYDPNKAYLLHGSWLGVWNQVKKRKGKPVWIKLELTPELFVHTWEGAAGVIRAKERGYLEIEASLGDDNKIHLSVLIDQNGPDEDGFGAEPDDYLVGIVAPDGTFIEPLHIE